MGGWMDEHHHDIDFPFQGDLGPPGPLGPQGLLGPVVSISRRLWKHLTSHYQLLKQRKK